MNLLSWRMPAHMPPMFSLDPATITQKSNPLLFRTGEIDYGRALVDRRHPRDFFMGLGIHSRLRLR